MPREKREGKSVSHQPADESRRQRVVIRDARRTREPLKPETRHGILVVILFTAGVLVFLSLFHQAGPLGDGLAEWLAVLFGSLRFLIPIMAIVLGYVFLFPERFPLRRSSYLGALLFILSATALVHLTVSQSEAVTAADEGRGGGYAGLVLNYPLRAVVGSFAAGVLLVALLIISLLVMFNTTLENLASRGNFLGESYSAVRSWWWRLRARAEERRPLEEEAVEEETVEEEIASDEDEGQQQIEFSSTPLSGEVPSAPKPKPRRVIISIPLDLLNATNMKPSIGQLEEKKERIKKTLENFGIEVSMGDVNVGPTVTQFTLKPAEGVKLSQITTLHNDLALALAAHPIRIEAPIPGMSLVGIEVPNESVAIVNLRDILESDQYKKGHSNLVFALGKDVAGQPWVANLDPMPHLLIAGATGSGKSVMMNGLILSLVYRNSPDDLKFILIDPKRVEFSVYNDIPHLLTPVITETGKTVNALRWIVSEMDRRFQVLSNSGKRNIQSYHQEVDRDMPYIVVVIDELADLMSVAAKEVEGAIVRLAQMARAVGIHLIVATQRPSVNVITGLIKANITARIAFNVASSVDSRTILDIAGAEKLLGKGDMLFVSSELSKPKRLQAAYVADQEIQSVVSFLKTQAGPDYVPDVTEKPQSGIGIGKGGVEELGDDELLNEAQELILRVGKASASLLQRRLRVGYARAARLLDLLEERGVIGPGEGAKPREILISREGYTDDVGGDLIDDEAEESDTPGESENEAKRSGF